MLLSARYLSFENKSPSITIDYGIGTVFVSRSFVCSPSNTAIDIPLDDEKPAKPFPFPEQSVQSQLTFDYFGTLARMKFEMCKLLSSSSSISKISVKSLESATTVFESQEAVKEAT